MLHPLAALLQHQSFLSSCQLLSQSPKSALQSKGRLVGQALPMFLQHHSFLLSYQDFSQFPKSASQSKGMFMGQPSFSCLQQ